MGLEDDGDTRWDQFEANKRLFNVTTTFKEVRVAAVVISVLRCSGSHCDAAPPMHTRITAPPASQELYSTKYDPKASSITPQEAARIAAEIERDARGTSNPHLREERGLVLDDSQVDEEDKYSAVVRQPQPADAAAPRPSWRCVAGRVGSVGVFCHGAL